MEEHLPYSMAFLAILFTVINLLLTLANYLLGRGTQLRNLAAKYKDRLYELNKLSLQYPDVASAFQARERRQEAPGSPCTVPISEDVAARRQAEVAAERQEAQMYAYVRFRINFYEEIYYATQDGRLKALEDSARWRSYVDSRLQHPLVKEAIRSEPGIYGKAFVTYALSADPKAANGSSAEVGTQ